MYVRPMFVHFLPEGFHLMCHVFSYKDDWLKLDDLGQEFLKDPRKRSSVPSLGGPRDSRARTSTTAKKEKECS